jgi:hypothetical protein
MQKINHYPLTNTVVFEDGSYQVLYSGVSLIQSFTNSSSRLDIMSGSALLASFPYEQTDLFIFTSSLFNATSSNNNILQYNTIVSGINPSSSYYFQIVNSASLSEELNVGLDINLNVDSIFISSSKYNITLYSGDANINDLQVYSGSTLIYSGSSATSSSFTLNATSSIYYLVSASILINPV